jgi:hypothetical protein
MRRWLETCATLALITFLSTAVFAQMSQPILGENTTKISEHVWAIMGFPNVAIIVGNRATLIVDTGLGPRNGATIVRAASKLSQNQKLFLTTTHFHPEHAGGEPGFPPNTILIRDAAQQKEMEAHGAEMIDMFASRSAQNKELLTGVKLRSPDVLFDNEAQIDLGGVRARLLWFGGAHTKGDELTLVVPNIFGDGGTPSSWLAVLDKIAKLDVRHVLPDHSPPGDGSLVTAERNFISDLRTQALALKAKGVSAEDAAKQLGPEFKTKYPDWPSMNLAGFVRSIYAE